MKSKPIWEWKKTHYTTKDLLTLGINRYMIRKHFSEPDVIETCSYHYKDADIYFYEKERVDNFLKKSA